MNLLQQICLNLELESLATLLQLVKFDDHQMYYFGQLLFNNFHHFRSEVESLKLYKDSMHFIKFITKEKKVIDAWVLDD